MILIGITGPARSGKDTFALALRVAHGFEQFSFAAPIRQFVSGLTGLSMSAITDSAAKDEPLDWLDGKSPREMMQTLGTEWGRNMIHPELWIRYAMRRVKAAAFGDRIVFSDVRFENEAKAIRDAGGFILHITRDSAAKVRGHASEAGVDMHPSDLVFSNDGGLLELDVAAEGLVRMLEYVHG